ncbi:MAG TPA: hypothetical protein DEA44_12490 [Firmicutes bacterium]|nr:hypothetical protein [Bacillota bacterium]
MGMKRISMWLMAGVLLWLGTVQVLAAGGERVPWPVENVGTFYVPAEWQAEKIDFNKPVMEGPKAEDVLKAVPVGAPRDKLESLNFQAYQVTLNDGAAYHLAWLIFCADTKKMTAGEREIFLQDITEEQKTRVRRLVADLNRNSTLQSFTDPKSKTTFRLLEVTPVEFVKMNKKQAFAVGGRVLITADKLAFPLYGKGYVFDTRGRMAGAFLVTLDGERAFWEPVLRRVMLSLNRR